MIIRIVLSDDTAISDRQMFIVSMVKRLFLDLFGNAYIIEKNGIILLSDKPIKSM
jgi:hypothetical protein